MLWADDGEWHLSPVTETKCLKLNHVSAKWLRVGLKKMHVGFFFLNLNDWNYPIFLPQYQQHMIILFCYRFFFFFWEICLMSVIIFIWLMFLVTCIIPWFWSFLGSTVYFSITNTCLYLGTAQTCWIFARMKMELKLSILLG